MHEIKMMKLETDVIIAVSVEPVLDVVVAITSIVLVFKQCFDRDSFWKDELHLMYSFAVISFLKVMKW